MNRHAAPGKAVSRPHRGRARHAFIIRAVRAATWSLGLAMVSGTLSAQDRAGDSVFRCGPEGRQYSDSACPDGRPVAAADARTAEQRRQAEAVARRDRELADRMVKEREQRERHAPGAVGIGPTGTAKAGTSAVSGPKKSSRKKKQKKNETTRQRV
jgi:hypothetical protein